MRRRPDLPATMCPCNCTQQVLQSHSLRRARKHVSLQSCNGEPYAHCCADVTVRACAHTCTRDASVKDSPTRTPLAPLCSRCTDLTVVHASPAAAHADGDARRPFDSRLHDNGGWVPEPPPRAYYIFFAPDVLHFFANGPSPRRSSSRHTTGEPARRAAYTFVGGRARRAARRMPRPRRRGARAAP